MTLKITNQMWNKENMLTKSENVRRVQREWIVNIMGYVGISWISCNIMGYVMNGIWSEVVYV